MTTAISRPAISAVWRSEAWKSAFFHGNALSQAGKIVLSMKTPDPGPQYSSLGQDNCLTRNTGAHCKIERFQQNFTGGPGIFTVPSTVTFHLTPTCSFTQTVEQWSALHLFSSIVNKGWQTLISIWFRRALKLSSLFLPGLSLCYFVTCSQLDRISTIDI